MSDPQWKDVYTRAYHQFRALALLSLMFGHSLSFVNHTFAVNLSELSLWPALRFFSTFGVCFVLLGGVGFRLTLGPFIKRNRITDWDSGIAKMFLILIAIETVKTYLVYGTVEYFFHWDFLKTLLFGYLLIIVFGRLHMLAIFIAAILPVLFFDSIKAFLAKFRFSPLQVSEELVGWNLVHSYYLWLLVQAVVVVLAIAYSSQLHRKLKLWITLFTSIGFLYGYKQITEHQPNLDEYAFFRNWLIDGLIASDNRSLLYSFLSWGPSVLLAFMAGDVALRVRPWVERHLFKTLGVTTLLWATSFYLYALNSPAPSNVIGIWDFPSFAQTSLITELFKIASLAQFFIVLVCLNQRLRFSGLNTLALEMSHSSYFIYILSTTFTVLLSRPLADLTEDLYLSTGILFALTLLVAIGIAKAVTKLSSVQIRFALEKVS